MTDLAKALALYSQWLGYGHAERAPAWLARLELNRPELEAFRDAADAGDPPYEARPVRVRAPHAVRPGTRLRAADAALKADAREAVDRAAAHASLNAFTHVALQPGGTGLLAGVAVAVKDLMRVRGMPLTGGSRAMDAAIADRDGISASPWFPCRGSAATLPCRSTRRATARRALPA